MKHGDGYKRGAGEGNNVEDEDDEEDDDYVPDQSDSDEADLEGDDDGIDLNSKDGVPSSRLSAKRLREVNNVYESMFSSAVTDTETGQNASSDMEFLELRRPIKQQRMDVHHARGFYHDANLSKEERRRMWHFQILSDLFGPTVAHKLMRTAKAVTFQHSSKLAHPVPLLKPKATHRSSPKKVTLFAGQRVDVPAATATGSASSTTGGESNVKRVPEKPATTKLSDAGTAVPVPLLPPVQPTQQAKAVGGLDSLLEHLAGPTKLSTVAKTSNDWEMFKQNQPEEFKKKLESKAQGSQAYLQRQDFLTRVDHRRFVHEKARRDQERAARGN